MSLKHALRRGLPRPLLPLAKRVYYSIFRATILPWCTFVEFREKFDPFLQRELRRSLPWKLPSPLLRYRIGEDTNPFRFVAVGKRLCEYLHLCLESVATDLSALSSVLDFGCGCGRTLVHLVREYPTHRFSGTDVDPEAVAWCRANLKPAEFELNQPDPPLALGDRSFDLIYGISVFTHLDKASQQRWIPEMHRLLRPGGVLIMTVNGKSAAEHAGVELSELARLSEQGVEFLKCDKLSSIHPDWYQTSFNDQAYTLAQFSAYFSEIRYLTKVFGWQDAVVCKKGDYSQRAESRL